MTLKLADYKTDVHNDWCPGCGDFGIISAIQMALAKLQIQKDKAVVFPGLAALERRRILSTLMVCMYHMEDY